ncbi:MAG: hypothetical protein ACR2P0_01545 [Acidimicrobiales bacterium]
MSDRYDSLLPPNLIAAVKSMPRRWSAALYALPPNSIDDMFDRAGADGISASEDVGAFLTQVRILEDAIRTTSYKNPEPLGSDVVAAVANHGTGPRPESALAALNDIEAMMEQVAKRLEMLTLYDWNKQAPTPDGSITVIDLCRGIVRVAADRLTHTERTLQSLN